MLRDFLTILDNQVTPSIEFVFPDGMAFQDNKTTPGFDLLKSGDIIFTTETSELYPYWEYLEFAGGGFV